MQTSDRSSVCGRPTHPCASTVEKRTRPSLQPLLQGASIGGWRWCMSTLRNLPKTEWRPFFDRMSKPLLGKRAEVEVAALDLGDQVVAEWIPMIGITYDSKDDLVDVALDRTNRLIRHPTAIT